MKRVFQANDGTICETEAQARHIDTMSELAVALKNICHPIIGQASEKMFAYIVNCADEIAPIISKAAASIKKAKKANIIE